MAEADAVHVQGFSEAQFSCKIAIAFLCFTAFGLLKPLAAVVGPNCNVEILSISRISVS